MHVRYMSITNYKSPPNHSFPSGCEIIYNGKEKVFINGWFWNDKENDFVPAIEYIGFYAALSLATELDRASENSVCKSFTKQKFRTYSEHLSIENISNSNHNPFCELKSFRAACPKVVRIDSFIWDTTNAYFKDKLGNRKPEVIGTIPYTPSDRLVKTL